MKELVLQVSGMTCNHCVMAIKKELSKLPLDFIEVVIGSVKVKFDNSKVSQDEIEKVIVEAGYIVVK